MSSVFSIELDGISNACITKVMIKSPVTSTAASEARNSTGVSCGFCSSAFSVLSSFFAKIHSKNLLMGSCDLTLPSGPVNWPGKTVSGRAQLQPCRLKLIKKWASAPGDFSPPEPRRTAGPNLVYQPQRPVPARDREHMRHRVRDVVHLPAERGCRVSVPGAHGPVDQQRSANNVLARHKAPIPAVLAVVTIVPHHEIVAFRNNQLAVFHQLPHLQPPFSLEAERGNVEPGKVVPEHVVGGKQKPYIGFLQRRAVDQDLLVHQAEFISGHADHTLDKMLLRIDWVMKHDD